MINPHKTLETMLNAARQINNPVLIMSEETNKNTFGYKVSEFEGITIRTDNELPLDNVHLKSKKQ